MSKPLKYDEPIFVLNAIKTEKHSRNRTTRQRTYTKINHAVRALWRIRNLIEGYITVALPETTRRNFKMIARMGKKRAIDTRHVLDIIEGCPHMKDMVEPWMRLPNKHNNMFDIFT